MKKNAFNMVELLMVIIMIGIIAVIGLSTVLKPWEMTYKYGYNKIYNALNASIYNYMASASSMSATNDLLFPVSATDFCKGLVKYMNTSDNSNADNSLCSQSKNLSNNPSIDNFSGDNVQILLSNGMRLWIGANNEGKYFTYTEKKGSENLEEVKYYIVYVDLNGSRKPNTFVVANKRLADIVAFAVTDKYVVIPLGYPTIDKKFLTAYVTYPSLDTEDEEGDSIIEVSSDSMTFYEARAMTFGTIYNPEDGKIANNNRLIDENILFSFDFEDNVFPSDSAFRISKDYLTKINSVSAFDSNKCGDGKNLGNAQLTESNCEIKIYDYN